MFTILPGFYPVCESIFYDYTVPPRCGGCDTMGWSNKQCEASGFDGSESDEEGVAGWLGGGVV